MIAIGSRAARRRLLRLWYMMLLASLSSRRAYLIRDLPSDRVESTADPANSFRRQPGRSFEIAARKVVPAHVDVSRELWIGARAPLQLVERLDGVRRGLGVRATLGQSALHVIERSRALVIRAGVDG